MCGDLVKIGGRGRNGHGDKLQEEPAIFKESSSNFLRVYCKANGRQRASNKP